MRDLILYGPQAWCQGLRQILEPLVLEEGLAEYSDAMNLENKVKESTKEIVVLCGWPLEQAQDILDLAQNERVLLLFGCNAPQLLAALNFKDATDSLQELAQTLLAQGRAGLKTIGF